MSRRQLLDETMRMRGNARQHVFEVERLAVIERAALKEGTEERSPRGAVEAAGEQPVFLTNGDRARADRKSFRDLRGFQQIGAVREAVRAAAPEDRRLARRRTWST
jgi:hypothetical protein